MRNYYIKVQGLITYFVEFVASNGEKCTYESLFDFASKGVTEGDFEEDILLALKKLKGNICLKSQLAKIAVCSNIATFEQRQLITTLQSSKVKAGLTRSKAVNHKRKMALQRLVNEGILKLIVNWISNETQQSTMFKQPTAFILLCYVEVTPILLLPAVSQVLIVLLPSPIFNSSSLL